jgi:hypothetical protein
MFVSIPVLLKFSSKERQSAHRTAIVQGGGLSDRMASVRANDKVSVNF